MVRNVEIVRAETEETIKNAVEIKKAISKNNTGIIFSVVLYALILSSCDSNTVFDMYKEVPTKWHKDSLVTFRVKAPDTVNHYNLYINLKNTNNYKYSNLFLITELSYPNGKTLVDTLEYKMAKPNGEFLGKGFSDVKENKLWYKGYDEPFVFEESGEYNFAVQHAMRKIGEVDGITELTGIVDIGFRVETK